MICKPFVQSFIAHEDGAVTVDWVVLTAAIVALGIAVLSTVGSGVQSVTEAVSNELGGTTITTTFP